MATRASNRRALWGMGLALASPALAVGVVCLLLFATGYTEVRLTERVGPDGELVRSSESVRVSTYEDLKRNGDPALLFWSGFIVIVCLLAAGAALAGWTAMVWVCAALLGGLSVLAAMSIGALVIPLAAVLAASAALLGSSGPGDG